MGFDFHPTLWFVCRLCRRSFTSTQTLNEHKLACHLGECLQIKCIIFEERLLNEEWLPPHNVCANQNGIWRKNKPENTSPLTEYRDEIFLDSAPELKPFKNPYVSLTRITNQEIKSLNQNDFSQKRQGKMSPKRKKLSERSSCSSISEATHANEFEFSKQKILVGGSDGDAVSKITEYDISGPQTSSSKNGMYYNEEIQLIKESPIFEASTPENSVVLENADFKLEDANDPEFIVPDISPDSDEHEVPLILSSYTLSPASGPKNQPLLQYENVFYADSADEVVIHQEILIDSETKDYISNLTNVQVQIDTYDSELEASSQTVQNQEGEPEAGESNSSQHQHSDLPLNRQPRSAIDEAIKKPFMCETCFATFPLMNSLKKHMVCHSSSKPFKCSKCPMTFKRIQQLNRHQVVHGKESNFKCRFCHKCFGDNKNLQDHERRHTGDRPFKCPAASCDYAASRKGVLAVHIRIKHSEELGLQQFVCPTCGKTYGYKHSLEEHIRSSHSGPTPFHCTYQGCSMQFKLRIHLQRHRKIHK